MGPVILALVGGVLLIAPPFLDPYFQHLLIMVLFYSYLGACWNILGGYAGQFSFGHALFFGIGGYTSTALFMRVGLSPWFGMLLGGVAAVAVGLFIGVLSFRYGLRGIYFGLVTLAFAEMFRLVFQQWDFVGGAVGILIPLRGDDLVAFQFATRTPYYYIMYALSGLVLGATLWLERARPGYYFQAIREDEEAAEAVGVDVPRYKLLAMAISAFLTALAGTFYAQYFYYIDPHIMFGIGTTIEMILRPILGGAGTVLGPFLGGVVLGPVSEAFRTLLSSYQGAYLLVYGIVLVLVMIFLPGGLMGLLREGLARLGRTGRG